VNDEKTMTEQFVAARPEEVATPATFAEMSGFEFVRGMLEGRVAAAPIMGLMNIRLHLVEEGRVIFRGSPGFDHLNPVGGVHGGWYGTILDSALGCAVATMLPKGRGYTTLEYKINITRALPVGTEVDCEARASHAGRTTGVAEGWVRGVGDGKLYATGSTTCLVIGG
jgi:uncharacterized protein (TIGR00369 family)